LASSSFDSHDQPAVGIPTGCANKGERHEDTIAREVREETVLTVKTGRLLKVRSGFRPAGMPEAHRGLAALL
jgi:ADP-ribose pyrophosphatase YjhB (NUDIX family)